MQEFQSICARLPSKFLFRGVTMCFDGYRRSEFGPAPRIVGGLQLRPSAVRQLAIGLAVCLLLGASAFGQTRKYRSIT